MLLCVWCVLRGKRFFACRGTGGEESDFDLGLKAQIGVDSREGHVHSVATCVASVPDCHMLPELLHGEERKVCHPVGSRRQSGQDRRDQRSCTEGQDKTCERTKFKNYADGNQRKKNRSKSSVRAKVEHVFSIHRRNHGPKRNNSS